MYNQVLLRTTLDYSFIKEPLDFNEKALLLTCV